MNRKVGKAGADLLRGVLALVKERMPAGQGAQVEEFARQFYRQVDPEDLRDRDPVDLYGAAVSAWYLAQHRDADEIKLRILNPRADEHGWQSPHTVVEIVNRDMPFLVDSVRMEINAQGFATHLIVHPVIAVRRDAAGKLAGIAHRAGQDKDARFESWMHVEVRNRCRDTGTPGAGSAARARRRTRGGR